MSLMSASYTPKPRFPNFGVLTWIPAYFLAFAWAGFEMTHHVFLPAVDCIACAGGAPGGHFPMPACITLGLNLQYTSRPFVLLIALDGHMVPIGNGPTITSA